jgi:hypothetical protein
MIYTDFISEKLKLVDPNQIMKRGYSITLFEGKIVKSIKDIKKGGKITRNDSNIQFYILDENQGVTALNHGQTQNNSIDGLTFKGLNGVFKVSDGVYVELGKDNSINYSFGFGKLINQNLRSGGYKSKQWVDQQTDLRWKELYSKSI